MATRDKRVDAYIGKSAEFAQPILAHLRETVHAACPEVEETLKWSMPSFMYKGILCGMAAFKQHCTFGFWKDGLMFKDDAAKQKSREAMGSYGRITSMKDLPPKKLIIAHIKEAMRLNDAGIKAKREKTVPKKPLPVPAYLKAELSKNKKAAATFDGFPPSARRDYIEWLADAKSDETRARRLASTIKWLAEGKRRNWKYERC
jgi:uncharacterized protein YdeI (YjbR/CyaY-like superfamily)